MHNRATGTTNRVTFGNDPTHVYQTNTDKTTGAFIFGRLGLDYFVSNRTTISLAGIKVHGQFKPNSDITTDSLDNNDAIYNFADRTTIGSRTFNANGLQFSMVHNAVKEGEQITFDGNFFSGRTTVIRCITPVATLLIKLLPVNLWNNNYLPAVINF